MSASLQAAVVLVLINVVFSCCVQDYVVPEPTIERVYPKGFVVKIPHSDGISVFAFHGKINEKMQDLEAGTFSKDVIKRTGNYWIFRERRTKLRPGDKIYYWLFVIKNGLGFRYDDGEFKVKEDTPYETDPGVEHTTPDDEDRSETSESSSIGTTVESTTRPTNDGGGGTVTINLEPNTLMKICESTILNITDSLLKLRTEVSSLKDTNEILREIAEKHPESARTLKVEGRIPVNEDALSTVKGIIKQKLALSIEIIEAKRNKNGSITFEVPNVDDKVQIIKAAKEKLRYSMIYLTY